MFGRKKRQKEDLTPELLKPLHKDAIKEIHANIGPSETIHAVIEGLWDSAMIVTNERVLVFKKGMMGGVTGGSKLISWELSSNLGVQTEMGRGAGFVALQTSGSSTSDLSYWGRDANQPQRASNAIAINKGLEDQARIGVVKIREAIHASKTVAQPPVSAAGAARFCHACGRQLAKGAQFCGGCGTAVS